MAQKTIKLSWKKHPYGGEYASYKLGSIFRFRRMYSVSFGFNHTENANNLAQAKKKIDVYTAKKTKS